MISQKIYLRYNRTMKFRNRMFYFACILLATISLLSCDTTEETLNIESTVVASINEAFDNIPTSTPIILATYTPLPTYTPFPTYTPTIIPTITPTYTPLPTYTPFPTYTPLPTYTPFPSPTPTPIVKVSTMLDKIKNSVVKIQTNSKKGSGVIIRENGIVITNYHVIAGGNFITVTFHNGSTKSGTLIASDISRDIAIISLFGEGYEHLTLGESQIPEIGDSVYALGYPLRGNYTVTAGIMSSTVTLSKGPYKYIQTDASLNPGNSGGPLVDEYGNLIGINTSRMETSEGRPVQGVGYALLVKEQEDYINGLIK